MSVLVVYWSLYEMKRPKSHKLCIYFGKGHQMMVFENCWVITVGFGLFFLFLYLFFLFFSSIYIYKQNLIVYSLYIYLCINIVSGDYFRQQMCIMMMNDQFIKHCSQLDDLKFVSKWSICYENLQIFFFYIMYIGSSELLI